MSFKKGQRVKVLLDETHNLADDPIEHDAVFVAEHLDGKWADVDLDTEHAGKTRRLSVPLSAIKTAAALLLVFLLGPVSARAQDIGNVALRTVQSAVATNTSCTGSPQTFSTATPALNQLGFRNVGQFAHQASATSLAGSFTLEIDGVDNQGVASRISNPSVAFGNGSTISYIAQGTGYFPNIQIVVNCTVGSTFSLSYNGSFGTGGQITGAPSGPVLPIVPGANVQGVAAQGTSGNPIFPVIVGGLQQAINASFLNVGIDDFNTFSISVPGGSSGTFNIGVAPVPTVVGELAIAFDANFPDVGTGTSILGPWACVSFSTCVDVAQPSIASLSNVSGGTLLRRSYNNAATGGTELTSVVEFAGTTAAIRQGVSTTLTAVAFSSNTLANSTLVGVVRCNSSTCTGVAATDTQGNTWAVLTTITHAPQQGSLTVLVATNRSSAAADTVTFTAATGTIAGTGIIELTGTVTATAVQPSVSTAADSTGNQVVRLDAQSPNQFVCSVTLTTNTTTQCQQAPTTINGVPVRLYVTDVQVNTTVAGTAETIQLKTGTGTNCGTATANLSAITYNDTAVGLSSFLGMRTPLIAPLQSAVCATQAGTAASTVTVEIHGFIAP